MINNIMNIAEYKHETVSGQGSVSWDDGVKCYIPSVKVTGKAEQEMYSGINLWDNLILQPLQYNAYVSLKSVEKSSFIITTTEGYTGNGGCNTQLTLQQICPALQVGKTYTLWAKTDSASQKLFYLNASGVSWRFGAQRTITQTDLSSLVNVYGLNASKNEGVGDCAISEIMVTESSVQPTYEPYVGGTSAPNPQYPIYPRFIAKTWLSCGGVNLWNNMALGITSSSEKIRITEITDSYIDITSYEGYNLSGYIDCGKRLREICPTLKADLKYYLWGKTESDIKQIYLIDTDSSSGGSWYYGSGRKLSSADLNSRVWFYGLAADRGQGIGTCRISDIMVTLHSTQPNHTPYFDGGTVQCPELQALTNGTHADEYNTQTGTRVQRIGKVELTGTEVFSKHSTAKNFVFWCASPEKKLGYKMSICSHFQNVERAWGDSQAGKYNVYSDNIDLRRFYFRPPSAEITEVSQFTDWLAEQYAAGTPVTLWYVLDTPTQVYYPFERLKQPKGSGQIIQTDSGLVADIEAKVLKHS